MTRPRRSRFLPAMTAVTLLVGVLALVPATAHAHAGFLGSDPENGSTVEAMPPQVRLSFNEDMNRPSFVSVVAPDGAVVAEGEAVVDGRDLVQQVTDPGLAGTYRIDYRAISADGHAVQGAVEFTVSSGAEVEKGTVEEVTSSTWWWIGLIAVPWIAVGLVLLLRRRSRS